MIVEMTCTCGACPVQYQGRLENGKNFYFRSRWSEWSFALGDTFDDAVTQSMLIEPTEFQRTGETDGEFSASWMETDEAERIIQQCVAEYVALLSHAASSKTPDERI